MKTYSDIVKMIDALLTTHSHVIIAIDGKCGSGKTTLGTRLQKDCGGLLVHMDDFYLQAYQRTKERLSETGGNVDYERFKEEVLDPLLKHQPFLYRPFDCQTMTVTKGEIKEPQNLTIIEGSYSLHPYFGDVYDLRLFMTIDETTQIERLLHRVGEEKLKDFKSLWIPKENAYFEYYHIDENAVIIKGDDLFWNN